LHAERQRGPGDYDFVVGASRAHDRNARRAIVSALLLELDALGTATLACFHAARALVLGLSAREANGSAGERPSCER